MRNKISLSLLVSFLAPAIAVACLWDYDTLKMERARFPDALELITGKFLRHSPEFYRWRIKDRQGKLKTDPHNLALYDDLAVAYEKTGQRELAIETIRNKRSLAIHAITKKDDVPQGEYETEANLGTFLMLDGQLDQALLHLQQAIKINPDAHFGREKYQLLLLEYMQSRLVDGKLTLPLAECEVAPDGNDLTMKASFATYLERRRSPGVEESPWFTAEERQAALKGIMGMMKFADHENPVLLEALGNVLAGHTEQHEEDAKQLAARAYLKASYVVPDEQAKVRYRLMAKNVLYPQTQPDEQHTSLTRVQREFDRESQEAAAWYAELRDKEIAWIKAGKNADAEFDKLYDLPPRIEAVSEGEVIRETRRSRGLWAASGIGGLVMLVGILLVRWRFATRPLKKPVAKGPYV